MTTVDTALLFLRLTGGLVFAVHGAQKVFGWWEGPGMEAWAATMGRMRFRPTRLFAWISALAELVGGLSPALGGFPPLAAAVLVGQTVVIIVGAHWSRGFFNRDNGIEFPLVLGAAIGAVLLGGPGAWSIDAAGGFRLDPQVLVALLTVAIVGGLALLALRPVLARTTEPAGTPPRPTPRSR